MAKDRAAEALHETLYALFLEDASPLLLNGESAAVYIGNERDHLQLTEETVADYTRAVTISYKPEYRHLSLNESFLRELARSTGGKYSPTMEELFRVVPDEAVPVRKRLWPWLLGTALLLFVIDVALRRLDLAGYRLFESRPQRYG